MPHRYNQALAAGIKPDPVLTYTEWADEHFYLPRESSAEYGRFRSSRTPFVQEPLDDLSPMSPTETVVLVKPTQQAGTTIALIFIAGAIDMYPGPMLMIMPTDSMARAFSKKKLMPSIKATPRLQGKIKEPRSRQSNNTILHKDFPGGSIMLTGSGSGASYRSESIKYLIIDDFDGIEVDIEGEGDPKTLADRRTGTFPGRKVFLNSTTTRKETSNIERAYEASSKGRFHVPCPNCGEYQYLQWGGSDAEHGIKFTRDENGEITDIWYQCEYCHKRIDEHHKDWMARHGKYVHEHPERKVRGYRYNALVCPIGWVNTWRYIAEEYLTAVKELREGNPQKYITWLNTMMAEPYEEAGDRPEWANLKARMEPYEPLTVPEGAKVLTIGTDVQHDRLATSVYGWGKGEECWLIYHIEIHGSPLHDEVWGQHDQLVYRTYKHASGADMRVVSCGVDASDGNTTQAVRNYCRTRAPIVFALKGQAVSNKPIVGMPTKQDITWKGEKILGGVEMWPIGTDTAKATLYARLKIMEPGPGYVHFYVGLENEFFKQLTAEKIVTRFVKGYPVREWHNVRANKRNEAIDCFVYAYAAALRAGIAYMSFEQAGKPKQNKPKKKPRLQGNPFLSGGTGRKPYLR
jgi:phage terminase large subunit GpA-like protein